MIKIHVVQTCPYTVVGQGVLRLSHEVIKTFAGAVYDKNEWLALLIGKRSEDGLDITVDSLRIPLQERSHASCELVKLETLDPDIIGVVHSHHNMGAFFSHIDNTTLNPRFPVSIVVARPTYKNSDAETLLGFGYQAEGRAPLPCGTTGIVKFTALPYPLVPEWPINPTSGYGEPNTDVTLNFCPHVKTETEGFIHNCKAACGVTSIKQAKAVFGKDGEEFMAEVQRNTKATRSPNWQGQNGQGHAGRLPVSVVDNRKYFNNGQRDWDAEDTFLRHWGAYGDD